MMWQTTFLILLAMLGGIAITLQGQFMGLMEQTIGNRMGLLITFVTASGAMLMLTLFTGGIQLENWRSLPWYAATTGLLGIVIVGSIGYVGPRMGLATGFTIIIATQLIAAALIDHYGWFGSTVQPIDTSKILGLLAMVIGVRLLTH